MIRHAIGAILAAGALFFVVAECTPWWVTLLTVCVALVAWAIIGYFDGVDSAEK